MEQSDNFTIKIFIRTHALKNEFLGYDKEKQAFIFRIKGQAIEGKANKELLKFLKELGVNGSIIQGKSNHFKVLAVEKTKKAVSLFVP